MPDEPTLDPRFVVVNGRVLKRVAGAENDQPAAEAEDSQPTPESGPQDDGTPAGAPETTPQEENWEQRFKDTQASYTQSQQELAQYRQVLEAVREGDPEVMEALGLDTETPDSPEEPDEPYVTREEWREHQTAQEQSQAEAQEAAETEELQTMELDYVNGHLGKIQEAEGRELTQDEIDFLGDRAMARRDDQGLPDVNGAWEAWQKASDAQIKQYIAGKKSAPRVPDGQAPAGTQPDMSTSEGRQAYADQRLRELEESQTLA